jgi:hypothetical protein
LSIGFASALYRLGRTHGLSANLLHNAAVSVAENEEHPDPEGWAFNGPHSLSTFYLSCLSFELLLKAAYVAAGGNEDQVRGIGHDLTAAFTAATGVGFRSNAPELGNIIALLREPYLRHHFRYDIQTEIPLPVFDRIRETLDVLCADVGVLVGVHHAMNGE